LPNENGFRALIVAGPIPNADAERAMLDRRVHIQPLRRRLFARDDDVDVIAAAQTMIRHRQQRVRIRRQIHANDFGFFVHDVINKTRVLMTEAVVILSPDMRS
jgi:hypothetical protein